MKHTLCVSALAAALLLTLPSSADAFGRKKKETEGEASARQTQEFVDARMHETMSSIDRSLTTLVHITRGGEPARKSAPLGHTAAGAAGPARPVERPAPALPAHRAPSSDILSEPVHIVWDGPVESLLSNIASQIGYTFKKGPGAHRVHVRLEADGLTLRQALEEVAKQMGSHGDIHFSASRKTIELTREGVK